VSFTSLELNIIEHRCTLAVKIFSDDFADRLRLDNLSEALMGRDTLNMKDKSFFTPYLTENLQIRLNGKYHPLDLWELDSVKNNFEASWIYYSKKIDDDCREISIRNSVLFDVFRDQKNLMIISRDNDEKAFQFTRRKPVITTRY